jgi:hemerythrin-like metal-binding protein
MPNRVPWDAAYSTGNDTLDSQHRAILAQCNDLADCMADADPESDPKFQAAYAALMAQADAHFATEAALLQHCASPMQEAHQNERDEFAYLANDIITTENFEKIELQRFLALWWVGHIVGFGKQYRALLTAQK